MMEPLRKPRRHACRTCGGRELCLISLAGFLMYINWRYEQSLAKLEADLAAAD
jgi:hypothetical protein